MAEKIAIRQLVMGSDGQTKVVYIDQKTKKKIANPKGYKILNDKSPLEVESKESKGKTKGFAVPLLVRGSDGLNKTVYVDPDTGARVDPNNREVLDQFSSNLEELGLKPKTEEKKKESSGPKEKKERSSRNAPGGFEGVTANDAGDKPAGKGRDRSAANDYGYIDKPGVMGFAGFLPGPLGLAGKAANVAINANNVGATNTAREMLGMEKKGNLGGVLVDKGGYIGDLTYEDETSPVGFEATTKDRRTTLTPNEARMRTELLGAKEATPEEKKENVAEFRKENPRGLLGRIFDGVKNSAGEVISGTNFSQGYTAPKSHGLASLSPSFEKGVNYTHPERGPVTAGLSEDTVNTMDALVNQTGSLNVTSAHRTKAINDAVGGAKRSQHLTGDAFDLAMSGYTPEEKSEVIQRAILSGGMEIGTYPDGSLHIGTTQRTFPDDPVPTGGITAMYNRSRHNYDYAPDWFKEGIESTSLVPTPEERPGNLVAANNITPPMAFASVDASRMKNFDPETQRQMAMTLAGEIDPSHTDLNTPEGIREADAIMSTMENRASRYGSIQDAIGAPDQFSTWSSEQAAATAANNYSANPELYDRLVSDYSLDQRKNQGFTSYYNPRLANPGWSSVMTGSQEIGPHRFGSLPEYKSSFGSNFGQTSMSKNTQKQSSFGPQPASAGVAAKAHASVDLNSPKDTMSSLSSPTSTSNGEDRSTRASTSSSDNNRSTSSYSSSGDGNRSGSSFSGSNSGLSGGGFGVGGDRSSGGKSGFGGGMSTSKGSTGGFGVGGDRSSEGKSSYGGSSTGQSKGAESRSDGWT